MWSLSLLPGIYPMCGVLVYSLEPTPMCGHMWQLSNSYAHAGGYACMHDERVRSCTYIHGFVSTTAAAAPCPHRREGVIVAPNSPPPWLEFLADPHIIDGPLPSSCYCYCSIDAADALESFPIYIIHEHVHLFKRFKVWVTFAPCDSKAVRSGRFDSTIVTPGYF